MVALLSGPSESTVVVIARALLMLLAGQRITAGGGESSCFRNYRVPAGVSGKTEQDKAQCDPAASGF
jgi:hypothetical protein